MEQEEKAQEKRLLILDDEPAVAQTIVNIAEKLGFSVRFCLDPAGFFQAVEQWHPTHIALDLVMPAMDGIEVLRRLGSLDCNARVILTSGIGSRVLESAGRSGRNHGLAISGILPKPFRPALLRELLLSATDPVDETVQNCASTPYLISEEAIDEGLKQGAFELYYQPKLNLALRKITAFEALVRWRHPTYGLLCPDQFIPFAEQNGKIDAITETVLDMGLKWLANLDHRFPVSLEINISANSLADIGMADRLAARCDSRKVDQKKITLEITESCLMEDFNLSIDIFNRLRIKGFELAIDDFGTGYSSMSQLTKLPFSELKIDKSFVLSLPDSSEASEIVRLTVELARSLGMVSVAEGVENLKSLQFLRRIGCTLAQGYFIARPMPGDQVAEWLERY